MTYSSNAEKLLVLSLVPKRKAKKVSCRQKPNIGLQLVSLSMAVCSPCFCNPWLWDLQKLTSSNIYIDGEAKMWRQLSADKKHSSQSRQLVSPWAWAGPLPVTFQVNHCKSWHNLSLIVSGVTVELLLCEKLYCPWTSSLRLKYSCNSKLPLPF